jgi:hypothetical protein
MNREQSRRECESLVAALDVPRPFDLNALCARIGEQRGKPIVLMATPMSTGNLCGMWMGTAKADYVFYEQDTTLLHQQHIVFHELGHILRGHAAARLLGADLAKALAPEVNTDGETPRILGRDAYTDEHEYEAELMATLMLRRVGPYAGAVAGPGGELDPADPVSRVERSLRRPGW